MGAARSYYAKVRIENLKNLRWKFSLRWKRNMVWRRGVRVRRRLLPKEWLTGGQWSAYQYYDTHG